MTAVKPDIIGVTASLITWGIKQVKGKGVREVITGTHLQNKEGAQPYLLKKRKTDTGTDYVFILPPGMTKHNPFRLSGGRNDYSGI